VTGNAACNITAAWTYTTVGNDSISFLAADTNRTAIHMWTFGDGSRVTGTTATIHHYAAAGTYTVCFYSYIPGTACSDTLCQSVTVTGSSPCPITAAWTYSSVGSDSISFIAADTNTGAVHIWNFGDGTAAGTTAPIHHYAAQGNYTVCFYVYIPGTGCSDTLCQSVQVGQPCDITAAWTYQTYQYGDSISCTAADTNASADHIWHLNGSTIVNGRHLELAFQAGGTYEICLYVYIQNTYCFDSLCQAVNISAGLSALSEEMPAITVMPNPFGQHTLIRVDGAIEPYELNIYDLVGKNVGHETSSSNVFNFGRGNLAPGIYIYEVILKGAAIGKGKIEAE